jgi:UDP-N-acetylmuramoyl-L-alanyl-D-glutamate--2,6-diaminopimelate ligase
MQRPLTNPAKKLSALCAIVGAESTSEELEKIEVSGIAQSSNLVLPGDLFIALPGEKFHGAQFASDAISRGAVAVLTDAQGAKSIKDTPVLISTNPRRAAGIASAWFYSEPVSYTHLRAHET